MKKLIIILLLLCTKAYAQPPDTLHIGSYQMVIDAYAYQNLMPFVNSNQPKLIVIVWLSDVQKRRLSNFDPLAVYVHYQDTVWMAQGQRKNLSGSIEYTVRGGPAWPVGKYVNVALKLRHNNTSYFVGRPCVKIEAIY